MHHSTYPKSRSSIFDSTRETFGVAAGTDWVAVDTQRVDLRMFPGLANAEFTTVTQRAGDCIFVP